MVQIFLQHTPRLVRRYTPGQAFQFLMAQGWYTLWSLSLAVLWVLPVVALLTGRPIANVSLFEYVQPRRRPRRDADVALEPAVSSRRGSG